MSGYLVAVRRVVPVGFLGVLPVMLIAAFMVVALKPGPHHMVDFHTFWVAAVEYTHRHDPYPGPTELAAAAAGQPHLGFYFYPPIAAAVLAPIGMLSFTAAAIVFGLVLIAAVPAALWILEIRDWRIYGATLAAPAVLTGIGIGTLSPLLLLFGACAWRWRNRPVVAAIAVGVAVTAKLFLWPLLVWLWFSRRRRSALGALVGGTFASLVCWTWISFAGLAYYPTILRFASRQEGHDSYSPGWLIGTSGPIVIALVGATAVAWLGHRDRDQDCFKAAIAVALLASPILWLHYFSLLPLLMLDRRRLEWRWLAPLVLWATPNATSDGTAWRIVTTTLVVLVVSLHWRAVSPNRGIGVGGVGHRATVALGSSRPDY